MRRCLLRLVLAAATSAGGVAAAPVAPALPEAGASAASRASTAASAVSSAPDRPATDIPFRRESVPGFEPGRWGLGVALALATGAGLLWWLRRRLPSVANAPRQRRLKVAESLRVSPRTTLILVELDGRLLLIGEQPGALVVLAPDVPVRDA